MSVTIFLDYSGEHLGQSQVRYALEILLQYCLHHFASRFLRRGVTPFFEISILAISWMVEGTRSDGALTDSSLW